MELTWTDERGTPEDRDPELTLVALWNPQLDHQSVYSAQELPTFRGFTCLGRCQQLHGMGVSRMNRENWWVYSATQHAFTGRFRKLAETLPGKGVIVNLSGSLLFD